MRILAVALIANVVWTMPTSSAAASFPDPERFEEAILQYEAEDRESRPLPNAIVCVGSSSMRGWHKTIAEDLSPLTVIPRGFGGSNINDVIHYADRIVLNYRPRAVLLYEGDNDIALGIAPEVFVAGVDSFVAMLHQALPETRLYILSVKPSIKRWAIWPNMVKANRLLKAVCSADSLLTYIDIAAPMLDENGAPRHDIFKEDNLHMNTRGYGIWTAAVRPVLIEREDDYEGCSNR